MVVPILSYGAEIWGYERRNSIEQVHSKYCKDYLGINVSINDSMALGECGRYPIGVPYQIKFVKYWVRFIQMDSGRYPKQCYILLKAHDEIGRVNWVLKIREFLFKNGFGFAWISQEIGNTVSFIKQFKQRLIDYYSQNWHDAINSSKRCEFYSSFKSLLNVERYLLIDLSPYLRRSLSRFRCSSHKLNITFGRHFNINREYRICISCLIHKDILVLEDEFHAFFICDRFKDIRNKYLFSWFNGLPSNIHLVSLFHSENPRILRKLAIYVTKLIENI